MWRRPVFIVFTVGAALYLIIPSPKVSPNIHVVIKKSKKKHPRYLKGATLNTIVFTSLKEKNSDEMIEREAVILKRPRAKAIVLIHHGYGGNKEKIALLRLIFKKDLHIVTYDFRAFGENVKEHHCCTFGKDEMYDVIGIVKYIKSDPDLQRLPIISYGISMGGVAALGAQAENPLFVAMILDCPYDSSKNVIIRALSKPFTIFGWSFTIPGHSLLEKYAFYPYVQSLLKVILKVFSNFDPYATNTRIYSVSPEDSAKNIKIPCFFIHCQNDDKVPVEAVKRVYDGAQGFKRLWITGGEGHFGSLFNCPEKYKYKLNKFIELVISGNFTNKIQQKIKKDVVA